MMSLAGSALHSQTISESIIAPVPFLMLMSASGLHYTVVSTPTTSGSDGHRGAAAICILLPTIVQSKELSLSTGIYMYVGEGLLPVPAKLVERITHWEFIEMIEVLPEF